MGTAAIFRDCRSFEYALDLLADEAQSLGFDAIDYAFMPVARNGDGQWNAPDIASRNFPPRWARGWARYASLDPYLCSCYQRNLPLDWNEVKGAGWLSETQKGAIAYIDTLGFLDGITVPIHLPGGSFAFVSGVSHPRRGVWRADQEAITEKLFVLAHSFHAAVIRHRLVPIPTHASAVSPREGEVLRHAAHGLSAPATARLMHRSVETVRRQRKSAMAKLSAHTMAQAVARGMSLGILEPD